MPEQTRPTVEIQVEKIPGVAMPAMATPGSAGYDLCASRHTVIAPTNSQWSRPGCA